MCRESALRSKFKSIVLQIVGENEDSQDIRSVVLDLLDEVEADLWMELERRERRSVRISSLRSFVPRPV